MLLSFCEFSCVILLTDAFISEPLTPKLYLHYPLSEGRGMAVSDNSAPPVGSVSVRWNVTKKGGVSSYSVSIVTLLGSKDYKSLFS